MPKVYAQKTKKLVRLVGLVNFDRYGSRHPKFRGRKGAKSRHCLDSGPPALLRHRPRRPGSAHRRGVSAGSRDTPRFHGHAAPGNLAALSAGAARIVMARLWRRGDDLDAGHLSSQGSGTDAAPAARSVPFRAAAAGFAID